MDSESSVLAKTGAMPVPFRRRELAGNGSKTTRPRTLIFAAMVCTLLLLSCIALFSENSNLFVAESWPSSFGALKNSLALDLGPRIPATLVTAYYPLSQGSKHSLRDYRAWMENFLPHVEAPVVIYLPPDKGLEATVRTMRGNLSLVIHTADLWELPPMAPLEQPFRTWQHDLDPERGIHSPELYAIWTAKSWMLHEAAKVNAFKSERFFWVDIGAWRHRPYPTWPDEERLNVLFNATMSSGSSPSVVDERMLLSIVWMNKDGQHNVQGGFFGGTPSAIAWWADAYYGLVNRTVAAKQFAGKEQDLMTRLLYQHPDRFLVIQSDYAPFGDPWFFFQPFLAAPQDVFPLLESENGWKDAACKTMSALHDPQLVIAGEDLLERRLLSRPRR